MNLSNNLTLSRIGLTIIFVVALTCSTPWSDCVAFGTFALASFTDWLDGYIARRYQSCTSFGRFIDPLADKILVAAALISLIPYQAFPSWVVIIIIAREFFITGLRFLALEKGLNLASDRLGKQKTFWQLITILFYLFLLAAQNFSYAPWIAWSWMCVGPWLIGMTLFLTLYSGVMYLWNNRSLFHSTL
ncbi:MAG: CDP-diacylglycerol--glycerol-3-phosphate 3-phosphatidyltransferase [Chthoniobacterales bacterium]|nr:CDP-diacylglycerol--glycerol-3-phosphate 3-phosphatidyltransferase [Chthoniobacterales bacterium]